ncbi:aspartyl-phosphate phosphatase Spo0E family protein [Cohnella rhizosphaerae]|uniref:Aspartyl-phosphate phosphatase Spo0E family protein n=1 Tax=Cohnella rhizosphaerae TaxID=1457232 RepID=A0A9X4KQC0_9BACL|nr:aspartyl-phosphate phosphatase Spo0E family protein [Cohnella rhizosphaerae]MDG0808743.1 aspartyl-phosphate phosphatase Spo0E family protein [Cohnella rhizosphaerae]
MATVSNHSLDSGQPATWASAKNAYSEVGAPPSYNDRSLIEEIDLLRRRMTETFLKEDSFTAEPVMEISRMLDVKINEYMRLSYHTR